MVPIPTYLNLKHQLFELHKSLGVVKCTIVHTVYSTSVHSHIVYLHCRCLSCRNRPAHEPDQHIEYPPYFKLNSTKPTPSTSRYLIVVRQNHRKNTESENEDDPGSNIDAQSYPSDRRRKHN